MSRETASRIDPNKLNWPRWAQLLLILALVLLVGNRMTEILDTI